MDSKTLGPDNEITVVDVEGRADAADVNDMLDEISLEYGAHKHSLVGCVRHDALVGDMRWKHNDSGDDWALVCGSVGGVMAGGKVTVEVLFAEDADQGDPSFTEAPTVGMLVMCDADECAVPTLSAVSTTGCTAEVWERIGTINAFTVMWWALGKVS